MSRKRARYPSELMEYWASETRGGTRHLVTVFRRTMKGLDTACDMRFVEKDRVRILRGHYPDGPVCDQCLAVMRATTVRLPFSQARDAKRLSEYERLSEGEKAVMDAIDEAAYKH